MSQSIRRINNRIERYKNYKEDARKKNDYEEYKFWDNQITLSLKYLYSRKKNKLKNEKQERKNKGF